MRSSKVYFQVNFEVFPEDCFNPQSLVQSVRLLLEQSPDILLLYYCCGRPLATDPEVRVRFPALPDFLRSSGYETEAIPS
jgi:hypothetical protein